MLYNRFSDLWPPALDCLVVLINKHKELVWRQSIQFMAIHQWKGLTEKPREAGSCNPTTVDTEFIVLDYPCYLNFIKEGAGGHGSNGKVKAVTRGKQMPQQITNNQRWGGNGVVASGKVIVMRLVTELR